MKSNGNDSNVMIEIIIVMSCNYEALSIVVSLSFKPYMINLLYLL